MPIWNSAIECIDRSSLEELQLQRLQSVVKRCYDRVPWYTEKMDQLNVKPEDIKTLADITKLPFTDKTALRDTFPFGMFAEKMKDVVRLHASSGTTGKPIVVGYTQNDLDTWTECIARNASAAGVTDEDRAQVAFIYSMFTGGWGLHYGLEKIGCTLIPAGSGNTERHIQMIQDYGTSVIVATPSYAYYLAETLKKLGVKPDDTHLRIGMFGGEGCSSTTKREVEQNLGIKAFNIYGLTEVMGPGVAGECEHSNGWMHINEDHFYPEIIDPETGEVLPDGEEGELVFTTITKEAFPVLRFRTHDITRLDRTPCACGRTQVRMGRVKHRTDDMLIIKGVNIFPSQFEDILTTIPEASSQYAIIVNRIKGMDTIELKLEIEEQTFIDSVGELETLRRRLSHTLQSQLGIRVEVTLVEPGTLERTQGKSKRVIDLRKDEGVF